MSVYAVIRSVNSMFSFVDMREGFWEEIRTELAFFKFFIGKVLRSFIACSVECLSFFCVS